VPLAKDRDLLRHFLDAAGLEQHFSQQSIFFVPSVEAASRRERGIDRWSNVIMTPDAAAVSDAKAPVPA
jgi:hypothetical protein